MILVRGNRSTPTADDAIKSDEVVDPLTGEVLNIEDVDALIDLYERVSNFDRRLYATKRRLAEIFWDSTKATGSLKTRRLRGKSRAVKLTAPRDGWHQDILREAWHAYPSLRDECLSIGSVNVSLRGLAKLLSTSGPKDFETFVGMVKSANKGPSGSPSVKVEI